MTTMIFILILMTVLGIDTFAYSLADRQVRTANNKYMIPAIGGWWALIDSKKERDI